MYNFFATLLRVLCTSKTSCWSGGVAACEAALHRRSTFVSTDTNLCTLMDLSPWRVATFGGLILGGIFPPFTGSSQLLLQLTVDGVLLTRLNCNSILPVDLGLSLTQVPLLPLGLRLPKLGRLYPLVIGSGRPN